VPGNDAATATTTVQAAADLAVAKSAELDLTNPSSRVIYTVVVNNPGSSDAQGVSIKDELPLDPKKIVYLFDTGNGACAYDQTTHDIDCAIGTLPAGGSWTVKFYMDVRGAVGTITNKVSVTSSTADPVAANNTAYEAVKIKGGKK